VQTEVAASGDVAALWHIGQRLDLRALVCNGTNFFT